MTAARMPIIILILAALVAAVLSSVFIVEERQQALVVEFGKVKKIIREPGLNFKYPVINQVTVYDDRILPLETQEIEVTPSDGRRLSMDAFARWRIVDPQQFRKAVISMNAGESRLKDFLKKHLLGVLGKVTSEQILSGERRALMEQIRELTRNDAAELGVEVVDVRIRRSDLPEQNLAATYQRMASERQQLAEDERARGDEEARIIRAEAERISVETVSKAQRESEILRGRADAKRNALFAEAFERDPEFFEFYRSLSAYEEALKGSNSTMVISPNSEFFDYLKDDQGRK